MPNNLFRTRVYATTRLQRGAGDVGQPQADVMVGEVSRILNASQANITTIQPVMFRVGLETFRDSRSYLGNDDITV